MRGYVGVEEQKFVSVGMSIISALLLQSTQRNVPSAIGQNLK